MLVLTVLLIAGKGVFKAQSLKDKENKMIQKATKCYILQSKTEPYLSDLANKMLTQSQQQRDDLVSGVVYMNMPTKAGESDGNVEKCGGGWNPREEVLAD